MGRVFVVLLVLAGVLYTCSHVGDGLTLEDIFLGGTKDSADLPKHDYLQCCVSGNLSLRFEQQGNTFRNEDERYQMGNILLVGSLNNRGDREVQEVVVEIRTRHDKHGLDDITTVSVGPLAPGERIDVREFAMNLPDTTWGEDPNSARFQGEYDIFLARVVFPR